MSFWKDRRRMQSGTTLVELLVSLTIIGFALVIVVGALSNGLLDSSLAKRNVAVEAATQFEVEKIAASAFNPSAPPYSDCFAVDNPSAPVSPAGGFKAACPSGYALRADVDWAPLPSANGVQVWSVSISAQPGTLIGSPLSLYKTAHA